MGVIYFARCAVFFSNILRAAFLLNPMDGSDHRNISPTQPLVNVQMRQPVRETPKGEDYISY